MMFCFFIVACFIILGVFRECGGARCAHNMVPYSLCRQQALHMVQQLVLSNGGDDDMGTLLGFMHTAPQSALELKTHVLKVFIILKNMYHNISNNAEHKKFRHF